MTVNTHHDSLIRHAAELEAEAAILERKAAVQVTQVQPHGYSTARPTQQQQQERSAGSEDSHTPKD
jgi:hypothetical protein